VKIRRATPGDLPILSAIFRRASWSNEGDRALLTDHPEFLELGDTAVREGRTQLAVVGGRPVGFVTLLETSSAAEVEDLFVDPDFMRQGIGRALVDAIAAVAAEGGWRQIEVDANPHAQEFYAKAGFVPAGPAALEHGEGTRMCRPT
jgi:GNAT superfamily N-acetyltransferase